MPGIQSDSEESSVDGPLDVQGDDGWQDIQPDVETVHIVCVFCPTNSDDVPSFLSHCKQAHNFDFLLVRNVLDLDFIGSVKLVNYLRSHPLSDVIRNNNGVPNPADFEDDKFLKPLLQDDALLYSLDELPNKSSIADGKSPLKPPEQDPSDQVKELQDQLDQLRDDFADYKLRVDQSFHKNLNEVEAGLPNLLGDLNSSQDIPSKLRRSRREAARLQEYENDYFNSYSYNTIHETMLKDTVRTNAYRDFIYDKKHLFANKTVLDIGCGTGILSMFAARAGAKVVIAVDNSSILDKARENVIENELQDTVKCIQGKIEEVQLPVKQVDIIISEWMGYCLLYEAMLDSVLWARDHYLAPNGLVVPSHANIRIAPFTDEDLVAEHIDFWKDVYGFRMTGMAKTAFDDILIHTLSPPTGNVIGGEDPFLNLNLHTCTPADLTFSSAPFTSPVSLPESSSSSSPPTSLFTGFIISFDIFFLHSRDEPLPNPSNMDTAKQNNITAFTTGSSGPATHWQQGLLLVKQPLEVKNGDVISGTVAYGKRKGEARGLDITVTYRVGERDETTGKGEEIKMASEGGKTQVWSL